MIDSRRAGRKLAVIAAIGLIFTAAGRAHAQLTADQAAAMVLSSARKAYNEKTYPFAAERFREFLAKYGGHKDAASARYGLALALLAGPTRKYIEIRDRLQAAAVNKNLPEYPHVVFHLGRVLRRLGIEELKIAEAKPAEAAARRQAALRWFEDARQQFALAMTAFMPAPVKAADDAKKAPPLLAWAAQARCYQGEMLLRLQKAKEARELTAGFLEDPVLSTCRYRDLGRYYHGHAAFLLQDYAGAERTLSLLSPFSDLGFGTHARYLLARSKHLLNKHTEAKVHYDGVLSDYGEHRKSATALLSRSALFEGDPWEKERLEVLAKGPPPDEILRATFYLGVLLYEARQFNEARQSFAEFAKLYPKAPLRADAELRLGFCQAQLQDFAEAIKSLTPLDKERRLADQATFWIGKAQAGSAPDAGKDPAGYQKALLQALGTYRQAADRAQQIFRQPASQSEAAEAALRFAQYQKEEGLGRIDLARKALAAAVKPEETKNAGKLMNDGYKTIGDALQFLEGQAQQWKTTQPALAARARMYYEAAWGYRVLANRDIETARVAKVLEITKQQGRAAVKLSPAEIPLAAIPLQASEKKAWGMYQALLEGFPHLPFSTDARFELADLYVTRHEYDPALKLLSDGLERDPPAELSDRIRLRLGDVHAARGDRKAALAQFNDLALQPKSPLRAQALCRAGEILMQEKQWPEAIKRLAHFQDEPALQHIPGLTDRALLRLGQAYAQAQDWNASRKANERLTAAFPDSPLLDDARYAIGWAWQQQAQYDQAVTAYEQVAVRTETALAAKAQLQIGLCRLAQKRYADAASTLLLVPFNYEYPELSAAALLEAARAFSAMKQKEQAGRLLERLLRDHPQSLWADAARERLQELRETK